MLPDHVQVGPMRYTLAVNQAAINTEGHEAFGRTHHKAQTIQLAEGQGADQEADTVLHETLHACFAISGIGASVSTAEEERIVAAISPLLLDTLRRNPELVAYLLGEAREVS